MPKCSPGESARGGRGESGRKGLGERVGGHLAESGPGGICRTHRVDTNAYFSPIFRGRPEVLDRLARKKASPRLSQRC